MFTANELIVIKELLIGFTEVTKVCEPKRSQEVKEATTPIIDKINRTLNTAIIKVDK